MNRMFSKKILPLIAALLIGTGTVKATGTPIAKGYAYKNMLGAITALHPDMPVSQAMLQSPLAAEVSRDWLLEVYGSFEEVPDLEAKQVGRLKQVFSTHTPLNSLTRLLFNVIDGFNVNDRVAQPTTRPSNPFFGLDAKTIAYFIKILHGEEGLQRLIEKLQEQCQAEQRPNKEKAKSSSPSSTGDDAIRRWYDVYSKNAKSGKLTDFGRFKKALREQFIPLLQALDTQASTTELKAKNLADLSKLLICFLFFKDNAQATSDPAYGIPTYFKALDASSFSGTCYTQEELQELDKLFKGEPTSASVEGNIRGVETVAFYLADKIYGGIQALQAPYTTFKSTPVTDPTNRFEGHEFIYCIESAVESIANFATYDETTGKLNLRILPPAIQEKMNPAFTTFIQENADLSVDNYYQKATAQFLPLVSGIENVMYKQDAAQGKFEISGLPGPKSILTILNHLFGTSADSFETLGTLLSSENRVISFTPSSAGYTMRLTKKGRVIAQGTLLSRENFDHGAFLVQNGGLYDLIASKNFVPLVEKANEVLENTFDLFAICFTQKTLHPVQTPDRLPLLLFAARHNLTASLITMLRYERAEVDYNALLRVACRGSGSADLFVFLLNHISNPDYIQLVGEAARAGNTNAVKFFLPRIENPIYTNLLEHAASSGSDNVELVKFLLSHVPSPNYNSLLRHAAFSGSTALMQFFLDRGATLQQGPISSRSILHTAIRGYQLFFHHIPQLRRSDVEYKDQYVDAIRFLVGKGVPVSQMDVELIIDTNNLALVEFLLGHLNNPDHTALLERAIRLGKISILEFLIKKGASIRDVDAQKKSALALALESYEEKIFDEPTVRSIVRFLLEKGAVISPETLKQYIATDEMQLVSALLSGIIDPDYNQLLRVALASNSTRLTALFLEKGADANALDARGESPLDVAIEARGAQLIKPLIKNGADVNARNSTGKTPLDQALALYTISPQPDKAKVIKELVNEGATVTEDNIAAVNLVTDGYHIASFLKDAYTKQLWGLSLSPQETYCVEECIRQS